MLKNLFLIGVFIITLTASGDGQRNNIYAELGGAGYSMTINYERLFVDKILIRMGYGSGNGKSEKDNSIDAIILRIDSGGGSALASDQMWKEISNITNNKEKNVPFIASMSGIAASGGSVR